MLRRQLVPVLTFLVGAGLALGGCGSSSPSTDGGGTPSTDGASGGSVGSTGGAGGSATGGAGGSATGGAGGAATGGAGGASTGGAGGSAGAGGSPNLGCGMGANSCTKAETDAQNKCLSDKCEAAYKPCIGEGWRTGNFGGSCGTWFKCFNACGCGNFTCAMACGLPPAECQSCLETANMCQTSMCPQPACYGTKADAGTTNPGTDGGAGTGCEDLKKCCDTMAESQAKMACNQVVASMSAQACAGTLNAFKGAGMCQ